jgi:hypothetical protein
MPKSSPERDRVQRNFERLRDAVGKEIGWMPTTRRWILPIAAFAVGVAIALKRRSRRLPSMTVATDQQGAPRSGPRRVETG